VVRKAATELIRFFLQLLVLVVVEVVQLRYLELVAQVAQVAAVTVLEVQAQAVVLELLTKDLVVVMESQPLHSQAAAAAQVKQATQTDKVLAVTA
jgi:hypothetical protein